MCMCISMYVCMYVYNEGHLGHLAGSCRAEFRATVHWHCRIRIMLVGRGWFLQRPNKAPWLLHHDEIIIAVEQEWDSLQQLRRPANIYTLQRVAASSS